MRILFMGTPEYAVEILRGLQDTGGHEIRVVTKPDAISGRGLHRYPSPVAQWAAAHQLGLDKPERLVQCDAAWREFAPDLVVTAAFGRILPPWLLALAPLGAVNLHASLLPRWRGPNPIAWAIWAGDYTTGVSFMQMDQGVDTGPVMAREAVRIGDQETTGELSGRLAVLASRVLRTHLDDFVAGQLAGEPQDGRDATYAPKFEPEHARMDWQASADHEARRVRSMSPIPGAYTMWGTTRIKIGRAQAIEGQSRCGQVVMQGESWLVGCGLGMLKVTEIQPAGKRWMSPGAFSRGLTQALPMVLA